MENEQTAPEIRLALQGSMPFADMESAEAYYKMLAEMFATASEKSTLYGHVIKILGDCCGKLPGKNLSGRVSNIGPSPFARL